MADGGGRDGSDSSVDADDGVVVDVKGLVGRVSLDHEGTEMRMVLEDGGRSEVEPVAEQELVVAIGKRKDIGHFRNRCHHALTRHNDVLIVRQYVSDVGDNRVVV